MKLNAQQLQEILIGLGLYFIAAWALTTQVPARWRTYSQKIAAVLGVVLFFVGVQRYVADHARAVDVAKAGIAMMAASCVFYEAHRAGQRRPVAERWKKFIGITLGVAAILCYFNGFRFGYPKYWHRWDQYHYYMGAKYFPELGYSNLYKCSLIAQDELGVVEYTNEDTGKKVRIDMTKEVRAPEKKIRNLSGDNLLKPASEFLDKPDDCKHSFTPARWDEYKRDVKFFRTVSDKGYWDDMQKDHGYNPPPVWTLGGKFFAELVDPSHRIFGFLWVQHLAMLDVLFIGGMFVALYWAFGWRVCAVGAIFWGCQSSAPFYWTGGAFLRQDWLFWLVLSTCFLRKRYFALAGASVVYAGLLRIFPGIVVIGGLTVAGIHLARHRRMPAHHVRMLLGGIAAAAILIPASMAVAGKDAYQQFYKHTLQVHDQTPLTNHMGLRVLVGQGTPIEINERIGPVPVPGIKLGVGVESGRMKYTRDNKLQDPFEVWKRMRIERYAKYKWVAYGIIAATLALFVYVCRRVRSLWIAQCLAQIFVILASQLTCYYYSFMILAAPLSRVKPQIEVPLFGLAALSQFIWMAFYWNDDKYYTLTAISLAFCYYLLCVFSGRTFPWKKPEEPSPAPAVTSQS
ncbi:hypothetical protein [Chondromyces crocatus]|uniref:Uncharacterized protein n=1 Tax=Chondromyces crocatus TaxID=52 RepID=A0A0K1EH75_CHOCO|nr:hypothetical protein [Chondromyces crocatus]AKT40216.1 uncharacterized protein CMC5_043690 [Chondromyces crocatus]